MDIQQAAPGEATPAGATPTACAASTGGPFSPRSAAGASGAATVAEEELAAALALGELAFFAHQQ